MDSSNPYAAPQASAADVPLTAELAPEAWRSGSVLIVRHDALLSDRCVKCNEPGEARTFRLSWHSPLAFLGLLAGPLPYIVLALVMVHRITVHAAVCNRHARQRRFAIVCACLGALCGIAVTIGGMALRQPNIIAIWGGLLLVVASALYAMFARRIIWPVEIKKHVGWIKGVGREYLDTLPEFPGTSRHR